MKWGGMCLPDAVRIRSITFWFLKETAEIPFLEMLKDKFQIEGQGENMPCSSGVGNRINSITAWMLL